MLSHETVSQGLPGASLPVPPFSCPELDCVCALHPLGLEDIRDLTSSPAPLRCYPCCSPFRFPLLARGTFSPICCFTTGLMESSGTSPGQFFCNSAGPVMSPLSLVISVTGKEPGFRAISVTGKEPSCSFTPGGRDLCACSDG